MNINVDQFVISDRSEILDLLKKCNQLGIDNYEMIGGTGGQSIYSFKGSVSDSPRGYYYNLNLFFSRPGLPDKTFIFEKFPPFSKIQCIKGASFYRYHLYS